MVERRWEERGLNGLQHLYVLGGARVVGGDPFLLVGALPRGRRVEEEGGRRSRRKGKKVTVVGGEVRGGKGRA